MNVRDYMHEICHVNTNTKLSEESQGEGKRKLSKAEALTEQQNKNKDLTMHMYKVLANRSKGLDEMRRSTTQRVVDITQKMMARAMEQHPMFQEYFSNPVSNEDVEMKLELSEANKYEMRIYLKSFPVQEAVQFNFGASGGAPHGGARVMINKYMGRVDKMIIKREWKKALDGDELASTKIVPWFSDGLIRAIKSIQLDDQDPDRNKIQVALCETGVQLEILPADSKDRSSRGFTKKSSIASFDHVPSAKQQAIYVNCIPCLFGTGLPKGMRLQHALPNREPYASQGKELIDQMAAEIDEGRSLYTLDACLQLDDDGNPVGGYWIINFRTMLERIINGARNFGKTNMIDPAIHVIEMISISRNWDIPLTVIETAALWEYKKAAHKIRNEAMCFRNVLGRLHDFFQSKSCPHYVLANYNTLKSEDPSWCEVIAKELGDAMAALDDDPSILLELTGTKKKEKRENQAVVMESETLSQQSHTGMGTAVVDQHEQL